MILLFFNFLLYFVVSRAQLAIKEINGCKVTTKFGLDILKVNSNSSRNVFFSPASISVSLGMVYAGSAGVTKNQISKAAYDGLTDQTIYDQMKSLSYLINNHSASSKLLMASRLYAQNKFDILKSYLTSLQAYFQSEIKLVDFEKSAESVRQEINKWVEDQTNKEIKNLFTEKSLDGAVMVLINAIYFKGTWSKKFSYVIINSGKSFFAVNEQVEVNMMKQINEDYFYSENDDVQVLGLPYAGEQLIMYILLPKIRNGLGQFESKLSAETFQDLIQNAHRKKIAEVQIPKFKIEQQLDLNNIFKSLGMTDMYNPDNVDLSGIDGRRDLVVSDAVHKAFIEVNEEGTEAASLAGAVAIRIIDKLPPVNFIADQPFLFSIVDRNSWTPLFFGRFIGN